MWTNRIIIAVLGLAVVALAIICTQQRTALASFSRESAAKNSVTRAANIEKRTMASATSDLSLPPHAKAAATLEEKASILREAALKRLADSHAARGSDIIDLNAKRNVQRVYGPILDGINISPELRLKIKQALAERTRVGQDAYEASMRAELPKSVAMRAVHDMQSSVVEELKSQLDPVTFGSIQSLFDSPQYIEHIQNVYSADMAYNGAALSSSQILELATAFREATPKDLIEAKKVRSLPSESDPTISKFDEAALNRAAGILDERQLAMLKQDLRSEFSNTLTASKLMPK